MDQYVLFHTYYGAIKFEKTYKERYKEFCLRQTPRSLSSSCGICANYKTDVIDLSHYTDEEIVGGYEKNRKSMINYCRLYLLISSIISMAMMGL